MGILSRLGIGNATVDLRAPREVRQGETVETTIHAEGGDDTQEIDGVYVTFELDFGEQEEARTGTQYLLEEGFTLPPGETREFEADLWIPEATPVTRPSDAMAFPARNRASFPTVEIETGMDIDLAVDPGDEDPLDVDPGGKLLALDEALTGRMGFELRSIEDDTLPGMNNFTQAFEYVPTRDSEYARAVEELDCQLDTQHDGAGLGVRLEIESQGKSLFDESFESFVVDIEDPERVASDLRRLLD